MTSSDVRTTTNFTNLTNEKDSVVVELRDTLTKTITIRENEQGDTIRVSVVTDRERIRNRDAIAMQKTKTEIRVDTVFIEKRDTIEIRSRPEGQSGKTTLNTTLKWVFWIIVAIGGLVITITITKTKRFF